MQLLIGNNERFCDIIHTISMQAMMDYEAMVNHDPSYFHILPTSNRDIESYIRSRYRRIKL